MRTIYNAKSYLEEILLGSNTEGIGFINESTNGYFQKAYSFTGYNKQADYSDEIVSVGILNNNVLEIGINSRTASSETYCGHLKNDVCRKLSLPHTHVAIRSKAHYRSYLNLDAGNKVAHVNLAAKNGWGSLGAFLLPQKPGDPLLIVSNNHVMANSNGAKAGDDIYNMDGLPVKIGTLKNFTSINPNTANLLDLAVAEIPGFINKGLAPSSNRQTFIGENVYKVGARTARTNGVVRSLNYTAKIDFGKFKAVFTDQIQITAPLPGFAFSQPGDSGSLIRSQNDNSFLGLLFAGNGQWTLANHQSNVIAKLKEWGYIVK